MAEPATTTASAAIGAAVPALAVPLVTFLGINTGLRPELLLAGFFGGLVAISALDSVPGATDTWRALLSTSVQRLFATVCSALIAAYLAPISAFLVSWLPSGMADSGLLAVAFGFGAGGQRLLRKFLTRLENALAGVQPAAGADKP